MSKHLIFYDARCGLCDYVVQILLKEDPQGLFVFASLQGKTASKVLQNLSKKDLKKDSLVLVENYQGNHPRFYFLGQGALRVLWLLGGCWSFVGWISFLPPLLYNWIYRLVARHRYKIFPNHCILSSNETDSRFLP